MRKSEPFSVFSNREVACRSNGERGTIKLNRHEQLIQHSAFRVHQLNTGGDDRIRTCEGLLTLNGLANRRLQPLGHISVPERGENQF